ncbi:MAG: ABC-2 family transporter protein [Clostridiales bacterium]|nr:ABC-2 family transporter protein [Clostridiales bacterium]
MKLYTKYISLLLKSQLQYKASFTMTVVTQFIQPFALFAGIYFLFQRFGNIQGWTLYEVFMCYAVVGICFATSTCFARGFDSFAEMIRTASFDRVLVRPRSTVLQILGASFDIKRIGHFMQSVFVLVLAIISADISWDLARVVMLANMILGGSVIFSGVYMLQAAAAFWTIEALEVANIFTHGIKEHASYPLNIFPKWITILFTFIIPFGTINYIPLQYLLGKIDGTGWLYAFIPLLGSLFIFPCILAWKFGVRRYSSAGS